MVVKSSDSQGGEDIGNNTQREVGGLDAIPRTKIIIRSYFCNFLKAVIGVTRDRSDCR